MTTLGQGGPAALGLVERSDPDVADPTPAQDNRIRRLWRRWRWWGIAAVVVVVVVLVMASQGRGAVVNAPLDPRNPTPNGAQALAQVLQQHGVSVTVVRDQAALVAAEPTSGTTVFVPVTDNLAEETIDTLADETHDADRVVVVNPQPFILRYLAPEVSVVGTRHSAADLDTGCDGDDVRSGERIAHSQSAYQLSGADPLLACFTDDKGFSTYLAVPATDHHAPLVLFGSRTAVSNGEIAQEADAAIVLRMLGHSSRVVWYVPSAGDIPATDTSRADEILPAWLYPSLGILLLTILGLMLWRGRRLGRLVREPLPAVVRAIETTESRGRLYRRSRDSGRAGRVLQEASRRRIAGYLGLPPVGSGATLDALVHAAAVASGRPETEVGFLLAGPPPPTDDDLLGLAARLASLEKEVRRT